MLSNGLKGKHQTSAKDGSGKRETPALVPLPSRVAGRNRLRICGHLSSPCRGSGRVVRACDTAGGRGPGCELESEQSPRYLFKGS